MAVPRFESEDEEAQFYLSVLRDGSNAAKIDARDGLAAIFARRGLFEEAAELYELNVRAGVRTPELFERLSDAYREIGEAGGAEAARAEAQRLRGTRSAARVGTPGALTPPPASVLGPPETELERRGTLSSSPVGDRPEAPTVNGYAATAPDPASDLALVSPSAEETSVSDGDDDAGPTLLPSAMAQSARRGLPGPLAVVGIVIGLIVVPVVLLALLVVNPLSLYLEGRPSGPTVDIRAAEPPRLKVAAGTEASWYLLTGRSVSGLWATPGLELTLDQELAGADRSFMVTAPRSQSWGETITIVERRGQGRANQETLVLATFAAPGTLPSAGAVLSGRITGEVQAPRLNESGQFSTTTEAVMLPVQLVVVSVPELWLDRFGNGVAMFLVDDRWLLVTIGALLAWCVLAGGTAILFRARGT